MKYKENLRRSKEIQEKTKKNQEIYNKEYKPRKPRKKVKLC